MAETDVVVRIRVPNADPAPALNAAGSGRASPGSEAGYTYHHVMPWRQCVMLGASFLKLAVYGDAYSHRPTFRAEDALLQPQEGESVGSLFSHNPELMKKQLLEAASGLIQPSATFSNNETRLLSFVRRNVHRSDATQLDRFLSYHAGGLDEGNIAFFSRPAFAGFWGMTPQQRADDPGESAEEQLPLSMSQTKAGHIKQLVDACKNVFGPASNTYNLYTVRAPADGFRALLTAVQPLIGAYNTVHPFVPSDWLFRAKGDVPFFLPWSFSPAEDLADGPARLAHATECRNKSFMLRTAGEAVTGTRVPPRTAPPADVPLVFNDPGRPGSRARMYLA